MFLHDLANISALDVDDRLRLRLSHGATATWERLQVENSDLSMWLRKGMGTWLYLSVF
jgi:hypothetical protein